MPNGTDFTPPFPAYPSGHATFEGACFDVLRRVRLELGKGGQNGDRISPKLEIVSDELNGTTFDSFGRVRPRSPRSYTSIQKMMDENLDSRVFLGVHWRFDGAAGRDAGLKVAENVVKRVFL